MIKDSPNVRILADSLNVETGDRCTTMLLTRFPYTLLQEPATHRLMHQDTTGEPLDEVLAGDANSFTKWTARSSASSRAIPVPKIIERIKADPFIPTFSKHQKGMQGKLDDDAVFQTNCEGVYRRAMHEAIHLAEMLHEMGAHKQHVNDLLKPFLRIPLLITATEWDNFFSLRIGAPCRHEFRQVAVEMQEVLRQSIPKEIVPGEWHIPFSDQMHQQATGETRLMVAAARCARLSYASHDGEFSLDKDINLAGILLEDNHMSPFEHSAMAVRNKVSDNPLIDRAFWWDVEQSEFHSLRNYRGFYSHRAHIEDGVLVNA